MSISKKLRDRAALVPARVLLPEGFDPRVREAAAIAAALGICRPVLLMTSAGGENPPIKGVEILDAVSSGIKRTAAEAWAAAKKITPAEALPLMENRLNLAVALLSAGLADAMVAGAAHATSEVLRSALELRRIYPGIPPVVSCFLMEVPDRSFGDDGKLVFADCGLNPEPSAWKLARIAGAAAEAAEDLLEIVPRVALLSFSTKGSAEHPAVLKVREALEIARKEFPDRLIDGEMQGDAALVPWIGNKKAPGSLVAGRANVLVFPDLNSGNIAYKLVERIAGGKAIGPVILGLVPPINDLSRGCSMEDILDMCAVTSLQVASSPQKSAR